MTTKEDFKDEESIRGSCVVEISEEQSTSQSSWLEQMRAVGSHKGAVIAAFGCSTTPILIGYDLTLIGSIIANEEFVKFFGVLDQELDTWTLPADRQLVWSIVQYVSAFTAAFASGFLNDIFGRRICFLTTVSLTLLGTVVALFSPDWKVWVAAKLFMGMAMGFMQGNTQTYVSEIAPFKIRGFALSLFQFWIILGQLLASCVLEATSHVDGVWSWKAPIISQIGPAIFCLAIFIPFTPESPYWLAAQGRLGDAKAALLKVRGRELNFDVDAEVRAIQTTHDHEKRDKGRNSSYRECFQGPDLRRTLIGCLPLLMQLFIGYPLCGNYLTYFLSMSGVKDAFLITIIAVVCSMVASIISFILIERVGRRLQLIAGSFGMLPCLLVVGLLGFIGRGTIWNDRLVAVFCILWNVFYFISVGAVGWTILGEISSPRLRAKTVSLGAITSSVFNLGWSIAIPYLVNAEEANLGPKSALIFLGFGVFLVPLAFFTVPETKSRTFDELDALFEARTPARKFGQTQMRGSFN